MSSLQKKTKKQRPCYSTNSSMMLILNMYDVMNAKPISMDKFCPYCLIEKIHPPPLHQGGGENQIKS